MKSAFLFLILLFAGPSYSFDGLVEKKEFRIPEYTTEGGEKIPGLVIGYETYGKLNDTRSNVILVTHHYSGNSHVAGRYSAADTQPGYWDSIIGSGKPLDTDKFFVIGIDSLVNVGTKDPWVRTTGPATINPKTKKPFGFSFPKIVLSDFVRTQRALLVSLGINQLYAVAGASGGAAQAVNWAALYPDSVPRVIAVVPPGLSLPPYVTALVSRWCAPILLDQKKGLVESLKLLTLSSVYFDWAPEGKSFEEALEERAQLRAKSMDAISFVYTARAVQSFNVESQAKIMKAKFLFIPAEKDMIFPVELSEQAAEKLKSFGISARVHVLKGNGGHLDGLTKISEASAEIKSFLAD